MGKAKKERGNALWTRPISDAHLRMNFLYQMAHHVLLRNPKNENLARYYVSLMKKIAQRLVVKIHPNIKRTICKKCDMLLVPGITATVRIKAHRQKHRVVSCLKCGKVKRFNYDPNHVLWIDKPEAILNPQGMTLNPERKENSIQKQAKGASKGKQQHTDVR